MLKVANQDFLLSVNRSKSYNKLEFIFTSPILVL